MKTLIISIPLILAVWVINAQEVTQLKEARVSYSSLKPDISQKGDVYIYKIPAEASVQFAKDPIKFMRMNFDIQKFIKEVAKENYDSYEVNFRGNNGSLMAFFDKKGKLIQTRENFKNVILPSDIRNNIYQDYKGWTVTDAKYYARTKGVKVASASYKVRLKNGNEKHTLYIDAVERDISVVTR